jgi:hypothetical protein
MNSIEADEADDSVSLDVESCGSVSTPGVTELFAMEKNDPKLHLG